ncbi:MAG: hypothetical protein WCT04_17910 [Planctomycetota bacterium]
MTFLKCSALAVLVCVGFSASSYAADAKPDDKKPDTSKMKADEANEAGLCPICKGEFKPVYHYEFKGKEYHFKTRKCCEEFKADPTKFGAEGSTWKSSKPAPVEEPKPPVKKK